MAAPAIIALPWLATFLGGVLTSLTAFFATRFAARLAGGAAWITLYVGMLVALSALFVGISRTIHVAAPDSLLVGVYMFLPSNLEVCLSAYISARVALWVYYQKTRVVQYMFDFGGGGSVGRG